MQTNRLCAYGIEQKTKHIDGPCQDGAAARRFFDTLRKATPNGAAFLKLHVIILPDIFSPADQQYLARNHLPWTSIPAFFHRICFRYP